MTIAGLVRLFLIGFGLAVSLLALDFLRDAFDEAFRDYGPAIWRLGAARRRRGHRLFRSAQPDQAFRARR